MQAKINELRAVVKAAKNLTKEQRFALNERLDALQAAL